ncbi:hypothetical protein AB0D12_16625 [Streptomyces sp. NPDC048479]|uniref:hypothetical protein n=1 Tax=Streptomyces sp. NPDC048479 TaxID=3154725 RepID=UPI00344AF32C
MSDIDFYVDAVTRNEVHGVPLGAGPPAWEEVLGADFLDDVRKSRMRRDYGLVEVAFIRREGVWESVTVSLQIHRLGRALEGLVPAPLESAYGKFSERVRFDNFCALLQSRGGSLEQVADSSIGGFDQYREVNARSSVYVAEDPSQAGLGEGSIWSIVLS